MQVDISNQTVIDFEILLICMNQKMLFFTQKIYLICSETVH